MLYLIVYILHIIKLADCKKEERGGQGSLWECREAMAGPKIWDWKWTQRGQGYDWNCGGIRLYLLWWS